MSLEELRHEIDGVDKQICQLLLRRFELVKALKPFKTSLTDSNREEAILSKLNSPLIQDIYQSVFVASKRILQEEGLYEMEYLIDAHY